MDVCNCVRRPRWRNSIYYYNLLLVVLLITINNHYYHNNCEYNVSGPKNKCNTHA